MEKEKRKNCLPLAVERPTAGPCLFFFYPCSRIFRAKIVYMVLGSSYLTARKILALGPSTYFCMSVS